MILIVLLQILKFRTIINATMLRSAGKKMRPVDYQKSCNSSQIQHKHNIYCDLFLTLVQQSPTQCQKSDML